ncbi:MAG TPA: hypothetical protein VFA53_11220, partial [Xanthobacteraceae bacterium]|nr:hypothetical protein [Xanthobacteraceae bacterium]
MPLLAVLGLLCLAIFLIPPLLLRRRAAIRSQEYLVACQPTPVPVIHNAGTGYVLRMSSFALLFTLGARGELWAVIIASVFLGLGFWLAYRSRETLLPFIHTALSRGQSFTLHNFIASRAGDDQRVRLLASGLTLVALSGFVAAEAYGLASFAQPLLPQSPLAAPLLTLVLLLAVAAGTSIAGNSGVLQAAQLQLGLFYFGLFGALALLLYLHVSELAALPPQAILAFPIAAVSCVMISIYRRSKYVDATPLASRQDSDRIPYVPQAARLLRRCEKILNPCISVLAGLIVALALMEIFSLGTAPVLQNNAVALRNGMHLPAMAMISLSMLPLFYPLVDAATWQRLAAAAKNDKNA